VLKYHLYYTCVKLSTEENPHSEHVYSMKNVHNVPRILPKAAQL